MKILHIHNLMIRNYGNIKFHTGCKLSNGIIRGNHRLLEFSDRDLVRYESPFHIRPIGKNIVNRKLVETCDNFRPNLIIIGHCDLITEKTLEEIKRLLPETKIAHWFLDALWIPRNIVRLQARMRCTDSIFVTTGGPALKQFCTGKNVVSYMPNPCDPSWESHNNAEKKEFDRDLVFCGVGLESDYRYQLLVNLKSDLENTLHFDTFGILGGKPVWGQAYEDVISKSKMALNLNREEGWSLYSSDRISQLLGNGLLTFIWDKGDMRRLFNDEQVVFFKDLDELSRQIKMFHADDEQRQRIAKNGYYHYHENFSAQRTIQYMIETTFNLPHSHDYIWDNEIYR